MNQKNFFAHADRGYNQRQRNELKSGKFVVAPVSKAFPDANHSNFIRLFITEIPGETTAED